ncbi:hypothetical protein Tco_0295679 [Tanacetum coccineum]
MKEPIVFPPLFIEDASNEPLMIEAVMEGYLVRKVYVDQGASVEVMFEHCFKNLSPAMKSCLRSTQMDLVGFAGGVVKLLGKIKLEVAFGDGGLFRRVMINFTVVWALLPYNVILVKMCLRTLQAVYSTIHSMVNFPTPKGIATLVTQTMMISEYQRLENKQMIEAETSQGTLSEEEPQGRVDLIDQILVNPTYPDQLEPGNMTCIPRRVIENNLNVNPSIVPVEKKEGSWRLTGPRCDRLPIQMLPRAYKGYHQVHIAQDDKEKTTFYTDQCKYRYVKMPFGLKNARATYQRLVDNAFQSQTERNQETYVDDMVIKRNDEKGIRGQTKEMQAGISNTCSPAFEPEERCAEALGCELEM